MTCEDLYSDDLKINQYLEDQDRAGKILIKLKSLDKSERRYFKITPKFYWYECWSRGYDLKENQVEPPEEFWYNLILKYLQFQRVRDYLCKLYKKDVPIKWTSAYRTFWWNSHPKCKGAKNSQHLCANAFDSKPLGIRISTRKYALILCIITDCRGVKVYWNFVHIDWISEPIVYGI